MAVQKITTSEFDEVVVKNPNVVLVDFFATWCMPCKMLSPVLESVSETLGSEGTVVKLDIDENMDLARKYGVMSVPTMIVVKGGEEVERLVGFRQANQILETLNKHK